MEHQVIEVKIVQHHCQKWKYFQNSSNFFGVW